MPGEGSSIAMPKLWEVIVRRVMAKVLKRGADLIVLTILVQSVMDCLWGTQNSSDLLKT
ncbi:protein of unknown function [Denitratisoma oestradiolicum]|uniref:Uncharacterized protein n=1 Tax=Denitratisoma oestradiolicum TaxID=311182 RepID=A0A6S6XR85_9PROT|nr:protein of unknown function [Denitratisoma oestradiolicum]